MIKIKLDKRNTNLHTVAGLQLLDKSIDKVGIIESYTISNDGVVISGNARHEKISAKITKEPIVIETDGTEAIIIKRTDIESNTKKFHEASILANTTAHKNFNLDYDVIDEIVEEFDIDVEEVGVEVVEPGNEPRATDDEGNFDDPGISDKNQYGVIVVCESAGTQESVFNDLTKMGFNCKIVVT
jgi:hypothetical protein